MLTWFWQSITGRGGLYSSSSRTQSSQKKTSLDVASSYDEKPFNQEKRYSRSSNSKQQQQSSILTGSFSLIWYYWYKKYMLKKTKKTILQQ